MIVCVWINPSTFQVSCISPLPLGTHNESESMNGENAEKCHLSLAQNLSYPGVIGYSGVETELVGSVLEDKRLSCGPLSLFLFERSPVISGWLETYS